MDKIQRALTKISLKNHFWSKKSQKAAFFYIFPANKKWKKTLNMSADNIEEPTEELFLRFVGSDTENQAILFEEKNKELDAFLT